MRHLQIPRNSFALFFLFLFSVTTSGWGETSKLWGNSGEVWTPASRLPDFSFAGYKSNREPIPTLKPVTSVKDFGAKGDGHTDDTRAFLKAIESTERGAISIPEGRYKLTQAIRIQRREIVLQGAGTEKTFLFFPKPLEKAVGSSKKFSPSGSWSWDGGLIWFEGSNRGERLSNISFPAKRGDTLLKVENIERFHVGQRVRLILVNTDGSLGRHLHAEQVNASSLLLKKTLVDFSCIVTDVKNGHVTIDRPIRTDVRLRWKPIFASDVPLVEEVGIENLTIEFPLTRYAGHHNEPGYNAIAFQKISNGWVRNVQIVNADSGIIFRSNTKFCTVEGVELTSAKGRMRGEWEGHHGFEIADLSQDNLFSDFHMATRFIHSFSLTSMAAGNVFMKGRGKDLTFDHHRKAPYENLFSEINAGIGTDMWLSGGDEEAGPPMGARETFWNVKVDRPQELPEHAVQMNVIGLTTSRKTDLKEEGNWIEAVDPDKLIPANLFESQLAHRRAKKQ